MLLLASGGLIGLTALAGSAAYPLASFSVSVSYTPSSIDPLQITFTSTVFPGTATGFAWDFGDGQYLNASGSNVGPGVANPVHRYASGGVYSLAVTVWEGNATVTTTLRVTVVPAPLVAVVHATALQRPLTYLFEVVITGGSATYRSIVWAFGDGRNGSGASIEYTYGQSGQYHATVNVTDTGGTSAIAGTWINATGAPPPAEVGIDTTEWIALGGGAAAGSALTGLAGYLFLRRSRGAEARRGVDRPTAPTPPPRPAPEPPGPPAVGADAAPAVGEGTPATAIPGVPVAPARAESARREPPPSSEALRISQRIVVHLAMQGALGPDEVASEGFTQAGISRALSVRQNTLTNVLRRLVAAEVLTEDVRHVHGQPRRLKVYRLTPRGMSLARDLRQRRAAARGTDGPS